MLAVLRGMSKLSRKIPDMKLQPWTLLILAASFAFTCRADESSALATLSDSTTDLHAKAMACDELGRVGTGKAVPPLAKLLADVQLHDYARDALERIPDAGAGKALVDALGNLKGDLQIGVIISLGDRREATAVSALSKMAGQPDTVGASAVSSLAKIASDDAGKVITKLLSSNNATVKTNAAHAALKAAQRMDKAGNEKGAKKLRSAVAKSDVPAFLKAAAK